MRRREVKMPICCHTVDAPWNQDPRELAREFMPTKIIAEKGFFRIVSAQPQCNTIVADGKLGGGDAGGN
jgi:hypothetical protein